MLSAKTRVELRRNEVVFEEPWPHGVVVVRIFLHTPDPRVMTFYVPSEQEEGRGVEPVSLFKSEIDKYVERAISLTQGDSK